MLSGRMCAAAALILAHDLVDRLRRSSGFIIPRLGPPVVPTLAAALLASASRGLVAAAPAAATEGQARVLRQAESRRGPPSESGPRRAASATRDWLPLVCHAL